MSEPRFAFLDAPLHALHERLKTELASNPFRAPASPDPRGEDRRQDDDDPANGSSDVPDAGV
jgi:hypothetical protein